MSKNDKTIIFIVIAVTIIMIIGSTFAYFTWVSNASQNTTVTFTSSAGFSCSANGGGNITSNDITLVPTTCTDTNRAIKRTITVNPNIIQNDGDIYLDMWLKVNSIGSGLSASQNFKYALTTDGTSCTSGTVVAQGNFNGAAANDQIPLLESKTYSQTTTDTYYLWIWLDAAEESPDTQGQSFNLQLSGSCTNHLTTIGDTLSANAVLDNQASTYVTNSNGVQFNDKSSDTNGKVLYIRAGTQNDPYPILYYRGAVDNNNVLFAGFCWKIVRTTSTGGTKLIYNGPPSGTNNNQCTNTTEITTQIGGYNIQFNTHSSPSDAGYMYGVSYNLSRIYIYGDSLVYMYGTGYDDTNHRLVTTNAMNFAGTDWKTYYKQLNNNHYTCFNTSGECNPVYYIYFTDTTYAYYVTIPSGKTISGMLDEMLTSSTNTTDSNIKTTIDTWYESNMTSYTNKLEDTLYCNERTIYDYGGWSPTGSTTIGNLRFAPYQRVASIYTPSLACNTNDAFTVSASNGNGKLTYPVGLLTADEIMLAGGAVGGGSNTTFYLYSGRGYWTLTPAYISTGYPVVVIVYSNGQLSVAYDIKNYYGVRPAVSLKPGTKFLSGGDGTSTNPYVVE